MIECRLFYTTTIIFKLENMRLKVDAEMYKTYTFRVFFLEIWKSTLFFVLEQFYPPFCSKSALTHVNASGPQKAPF